MSAEGAPLQRVRQPGVPGVPEVFDVPDALEVFRAAGVLAAADVHTAATLARLAGERDDRVLLAAALAVRAPRAGHVCVDLRSVAATVVADVPGLGGRAAATDPDLTSLPWPDPDAWVAAVSASALVRTPAAPLVLVGTRLYTERYHAYERQVAAGLRARAVQRVAPDRRGGASASRAGAVVDALLGPSATDQRAAVEAATEAALSVLVGGPGTGKTTTVAALLASIAATGAEPLVALAAPTGKAAARLGQAFRAAAQRLDPELAARLAGTEASTIHRLLGVQRSSPTGTSRFRHGAHRQLPHDVVVIDEASMVSLPLMAKLLAAVRDDARLVLVGDPGQLASVEAGSVLADVVGPLGDRGTEPADDGGGPAPGGADRPARRAGGDSAGIGGGDRAGIGGTGGRAGPDAPSSAPLAGVVSVLRRSRRFPPGSPIDRFASAIRAGDDAGTVAVLREAAGARSGTGADAGGGEPVGGSLHWLEHAGDDHRADAAVAALAVPPAREVLELAADGAAQDALARMESLRVLCAHRRGPYGVDRWNRRIEAALDVGRDRLLGGWYVGRPVLVTANDHRLGLYNGDMGVVVATRDGLRVAFDDGSGVPRLVAPVRLESVETVHAMTIHKSQGSEFDHVVVVLPPAESRLATRELLYTAVTRARTRVTVVGDESSLRAAVVSRVARASGLRDELWPG